jgi:histone acetyltransferase (RNA polymerase elongator complex component)
MATKTKKEKVIDFTKPERLSEEELVQLQATIRTIDRLTADVGRIEVQKHAALIAMQKVQGNVDEMRTEFMNKYGTDNINIQTGEIAYAPEETAQDDVKADS